jgi:hypothetical protein
VQERLEDFCPESMTISFNTSDSKPDLNLPHPNLTPISIPVNVRAPYYYSKPDSLNPFSSRQETPVSEYATIESVIDGLFTNMAIFGHHQEYCLPLALAHDRDGVILIMSSRGRLFKIPRETTIRDVVAGARWPRQSNAPIFEDLRRVPRKRADEIDGVELLWGWMMDVLVVPKDQLGAL